MNKLISFPPVFPNKRAISLADHLTLKDCFTHTHLIRNSLSLFLKDYHNSKVNISLCYVYLLWIVCHILIRLLILREKHQYFIFQGEFVLFSKSQMHVSMILNQTIFSKSKVILQWFNQYLFIFIFPHLKAKINS